MSDPVDLPPPPENAFLVGLKDGSLTSPPTGGLQEGGVVNAGQSPHRVLWVGHGFRGVCCEAMTLHPSLGMWESTAGRGEGGAQDLGLSAFQAIPGEAEAEPASPAPRPALLAAEGRDPAPKWGAGWSTPQLSVPGPGAPAGADALAVMYLLSTRNLRIAP